MVKSPSSTVLCLLAICALLGGADLAQVASELHGPSFVPDGKFQGSKLTGWHTLGQADWRAENGELIGKGSPGSGWLVLDRSYQDTGFYAGFRCAGACDTGVLLRATKTEGGMTGTYLSIQGAQLKAESLTIDDRRQHYRAHEVEECGGPDSLRALPARSHRGPSRPGSATQRAARPEPMYLSSSLTWACGRESGMRWRCCWMPTSCASI